MAEPTDGTWKIQASVKTGGTAAAKFFDAGMLNFRGDTVAEVAGQLEEAAAADLRDLMAKVQYGSHEAAVALVQQGLGGQVIPMPQGPQNGSAAPSGGNPLAWCPTHNEPRTYFEGGVSQKGTKYGPSWRCGQRGCAVWAKRDGTFA